MVSGHDRTVAEVREALAVAHTAVKGVGCEVVGMVANRVRFDLVGDIASDDGTPVYALPEIDLLMAPTVGQVAAACDGEIIAGDAELLGREALHLTVAAMTLPNLMERIEDGAVLITPGDRADVLLASLFAHASKELPSPAGIVLTGGSAAERHVPQAARRLPDDAAGDPDRARHVRGRDAGRRSRGGDRGGHAAQDHQGARGVRGVRGRRRPARRAWTSPARRRSRR